MKMLLALAALMLAISSVAAEALQSCTRIEQAAATAMTPSPSDGARCHDTGDHAGVGSGFGCAFSATCALLCGVAPPAGLDDVHAAQFDALSFVASADRLAGAARKPEAPPPRSFLL